MNLYYMRHGLSDCNIEFRLDHSSYGLNDKGRSEVRATKPYIDSLGIELVFSSPIPRALETANILFPKKEIKVIHEFSECTGQIWKDIEDGSLTEDYLRYKDQVLAGIEKIKEYFSTASCLIIAHGGNFKIFSEYFGFPFKLLNTSEVYRIEVNS